MSTGIDTADGIELGANGPIAGPTTDGGRIAEQVRGLIPLIRAEAPAAERAGALTEPVLQALTDAGVFRATLPVELGGYSLGARDLVEIVTALGEGDGAAGWLGFVGVGVRNVLAFPRETVVEAYRDAALWQGPVAIGASLFSANVGSARKVDGGWMVQGTWPFASGCKHAAWAVVGVSFDVAHGSGHGFAMLRADQFEPLDDWHVMGLQATASNSIRVAQEVFVPDARLLDTAELVERTNEIQQHYSGPGFCHGMTGMIMFPSLSCTAIALGMAKGALGCFVEQANKRKPYNLPYPTLAEAPTVQLAAGRAQAIINAAEATIHRHADEVDRRGRQALDTTHDQLSEATLDLAHAARQCADAIDLLQLTIGSSTVSLKNPIQRFARDCRVLITHGAMRLDPIAEINGRRVLGLAPLQTMGALPLH